MGLGESRLVLILCEVNWLSVCWAFWSTTGDAKTRARKALHELTGLNLLIASEREPSPDVSIHAMSSHMDLLDPFQKTKLHQNPPLSMSLYMTFFIYLRISPDDPGQCLNLCMACSLLRQMSLICLWHWLMETRLRGSTHVPVLPLLGQVSHTPLVTIPKSASFFL